jgi:hypothetical protein
VISFRQCLLWWWPDFAIGGMLSIIGDVVVDLLGYDLVSEELCWLVM